MTRQEIRTDSNFLCGMSFTDYEAEVYLVYTGKPHLQYYFFFNDKLVFEGNDFKPSPLHCIDSIEAIVSLLGFLTLKKGDADKEFFKDYTREQWEWSESSENEQLRLFVDDFSDTGSEFYKPAEKFFKKAYLLPE